MVNTEVAAQADVCLPVPGNNVDEGLSFLEAIAAGNVGAGIKMTAQGSNIPGIRKEYQQAIELLEHQLQLKMNSGESVQDIAKWVVARRTQIANQLRDKQGLGSKLILELRDQVEYGPGGRSYENLEKRALREKIKKHEVPAHLIESAARSNKGVSKAAIEGAKFLRHGGRVVVVVSISITAYTLLTAPKGELEKLLFEQIGALAGGFVGGATSAGLCIAFGVASGGWGLLACGVIGGGAGGFLGSTTGEKIYVMKGDIQNPTVVVRDGAFQQIAPNLLLPNITAAGC